MKIFLFKSKMCGPCRMFDPQIKKAAEQLNIDYIPIDVEEKETFLLWNKVTTADLIKKFNVRSSGKFIFYKNENDENSDYFEINRPTKADDLVNKINEFLNK